jgi:hypothetical protein
MAVFTDISVVGSAYDTSGNGGRKLAVTKSGTLVTALKTGSGINMYKAPKNAPNTWTLLNTVSADKGDLAIAPIGNSAIGLLRANNTGSSGTAVDFSVVDVDNDVVIGVSQTIESSLTAVGNVAVAVNPAGTEVHCVWGCKPSSGNINSYNLHYVKGTINSDFSVTIGAIEYITGVNQSSYPYFAINPSITFDKNGIPIVICEQDTVYLNGNGYANNYGITILKRDATLTTGNTYLNSNWSFKNIYNSAYAQASPSAIFIPQSINGLANGRIWVAWHGLDSTDTSMNNIRMSYSDDGGATWAAMQKLTSGNTVSRYFPSITYNNGNRIDILYTKSTGTVAGLSNQSGTWGSESVLDSSDTSAPNYPNALVGVNYTNPLFIYVDTAKVGFYGTYTVVTINVTPGAIGVKTDKTNVLTYAITTDGTMGTVTETINGTQLASKTPASGTSTTVTATQAQWDAVKYGKYTDATGKNLNTLVIAMGSDSFTYTFDKEPASTDDILSQVKAVQDMANTQIPAEKSVLAAAIRGIGGSANDTDALITMAGALTGFKKFQQVTALAGTTSISFQMSGGGVANVCTPLTLSGLSFTPKLAVAIGTSGAYDYVSIFNNYYKGIGNYLPNVYTFASGVGSYSTSTYNFKGDVSPASVSSTAMTLPVLGSGLSYTVLLFG